jgi:hypothetical protein
VSTNRQFKLTSVQRADAGNRQTACEIACVCGEKYHVIQTGQQLMPPDQVKLRFERAGWHVGRGPAGDKCPRCVASEKTKKPNLTLVTKEEPAMSRAAPPPAMSRDDRRVIFAKLNDIYLDEKTGYSDGWSDIRVAEDLGVPRAWIEEIRRENFGEAVASPDISKFLTDVAQLEEDGRVIVAARAELTTKMASFSERLTALTKTAADIKKAVGL